MHRKALNSYFFCLVTLLVSSCASLNKSNSLQSVNVQIESSVRINHAVSINVVFVYDSELGEQLASLNAHQWFEQKAGMLSAYGHQLKIVERELVPGYSDNLFLPDDSQQAARVFVFAYDPQLENQVLEITTEKTANIAFGKNGLYLN